MSEKKERKEDEVKRERKEPPMVKLKHDFFFLASNGSFSVTAPYQKILYFFLFSENGIKRCQTLS
jgi:predicted dithiol-disulfide oxidoreductase (DUF899 family)